MNADMIAQPGALSARLRLAASTVATAYGGLVFMLLVAAAPLTVLTREVRLINDGFELGLTLVVLAVGVVISRNRPENPIGWLAMTAALVLAVEDDARLYAVLDYHRHGGSLPLGPLAVGLADTCWVLAFLLVPLTVLLFPDGVLPSPRWRWVLRAYLAASLLILVSIYVQEGLTLEGPIRVGASTGQSIGSPHLSGASAWLNTAGNVAAALIPVFWLLFVARQVLAFQNATGDRRQQLKWLMSGAAIAVLAGLANFAAHAALSGTLQRVVEDLSDLGIVALPVSVGVAVLRYRLYEIDRLISRTLSYALLSGLLVAVFAALVLLTTEVLPFSSPVGVAASTLAAAALASPLRRRLQRLVDRRFNRARYDAEGAVADFGARLRDAFDLDTVQSELLETVTRAVEPERASIWVRSR